MRDGKESVKYSVIVPIFNEEASVGPLCRSLENVMNALGRPYEILFVDDGSTDRSAGRLLEGRPRNVSVIVLAENAGQSPALQAGFDHAKGEIFITLDGDGQDDPQEIPKLLKKLDEGYDVVCGWRFQRQDSFQKKAASKIAHIIRRLATREKIHDVGCTLRVFRRQAVDNICLWSGMHRFFSTIVSRKGFKITEVKVTHHKREQGISKYGVWSRLTQGASDLFRVVFFNMDSLMAHPKNYKIKEILRAQR